MNPILVAITYNHMLSFRMIILIASPEKTLQRSEKPKRFGSTGCKGQLISKELFWFHRLDQKTNEGFPP